MKIQVNSRSHAGVPLASVPFGTVVTHSIIGDAVYYIVVSKMDGTGRKCLVTLSNGTLKELPQDTPVLVVEAHVVVVGEASGQHDYSGLASQLRDWTYDDRTVALRLDMAAPTLRMLLRTAAEALEAIVIRGTYKDSTFARCDNCKECL